MFVGRVVNACTANCWHRSVHSSVIQRIFLFLSLVRSFVRVVFSSINFVVFFLTFYMKYIDCLMHNKCQHIHTQRDTITQLKSTNSRFSVPSMSQLTTLAISTGPFFHHPFLFSHDSWTAGNEQHDHRKNGLERTGKPIRQQGIFEGTKDSYEGKS